MTISTLASRDSAPDLGGRLDAVEPGHLDVEQGDVGAVLAGGRDDLVAAADLGDHLEVGLEVEQRGQRAADQGLVVGEQEPDGHGTTRPPARKPRARAPG